MANGGKTPTSPPTRTSDAVVVVINLADPEASNAESNKARSLGDVVAGKQLHVISPPSHLKDKDAVIGSIIGSIKQYVSEHGTIPEIRFGGHAAPTSMQFGKDTPLRINHLINAIATLQQEMGVKIADKVSFYGCNTFTQLSPEWVKYLRDTSKTLGTELVGTTDYSMKTPYPGLESIPLISFKNGEVGHFTKNIPGPGLVLDALFNPLLKLEKEVLNGISYSDRWIGCHTGRSQAEGEACQKRMEPLDAADAKLTEWISAPARIIKEKMADTPQTSADKNRSR